MTVARTYFMHAKEGHNATLETALIALADAVRPIAGCKGVELLRDLGNERRFLFIEKWDSEDAHKEGGKSLPKEAFGPVMAVLDGPPDGSWFDYLKAV
ncbi:MAG TPA: antibiotic biosynthesis monooxygenase family protein [Sphingobium sp.]